MFTIQDFENETNSFNKNEFTQLLKTKWLEVHDNTSVFRYKIDTVREKIVDNKYLLLLNPDRSKNRRTPEHINDICQPFDDTKFNFTKASPDEILFSIGDGANDPNLHSILVNISPISKYHSLLCPSINKKLPQVATEESLVLAVKIIFIAQDRELKIGFNSLCALASLNHLHYHLLFEKNVLPVEKVKWCHLKGPLHCTQDYPSPAFCFKIEKESLTQQIKEVFKLIEYFLANSIAHNILISRKEDQAAVYLWPRKSTSGVKQFKAFNVAICELSGWFPVYCEDTFEKLNSNNIEEVLKQWNLDYFDKLCHDVSLSYQ